MKPILLAEDDPAIVHVVTLILENEGYSIICASSERDILKQAAVQQPFVVLLDISLSGSDGRTIARKLRASDKTRHIPIVIVSADSQVEKIAREIKADGFLLKPFDISTLLDIVKKYKDPH